MYICSISFHNIISHGKYMWNKLERWTFACYLRGYCHRSPVIRLSSTCPVRLLSCVCRYTYVASVKCALDAKLLCSIDMYMSLSIIN
jgi:hypothetical protein